MPVSKIVYFFLHAVKRETNVLLEKNRALYFKNLCIDRNYMFLQTCSKTWEPVCKTIRGVGVLLI